MSKPNTTTSSTWPLTSGGHDEQGEEQFLIKEINDAWRAPIQEELTGAWDYAERSKMLAKDGIAAEIIFPDGITSRTPRPLAPDWAFRPGRGA